VTAPRVIVPDENVTGHPKEKFEVVTVCVPLKFIVAVDVDWTFPFEPIVIPPPMNRVLVPARTSLPVKVTTPATVRSALNVMVFAAWIVNVVQAELTLTVTAPEPDAIIAVSPA
jgi:hypothetical protein